MLARLLYRDGLMLVVDKPAGLPVHRGPKGGDAFEDYFDALRFGLPRAPALAHRLDRDTTGCLVLGRHRKALALLGKLFKQGKVGKCYWAVVEGGPEAAEGRIDIPLSKRDESRGWWMKADKGGLPSTSTWTVLGRGSGFTWLALEPVTGRTHQLRVHCAEMGWPIIGDNIYGNAPRTGGPALHLHSREVTVPISKNKPAVKVTAPVPEPYARDVEGLRLAANDRKMKPTACAGTSMWCRRSETISCKLEHPMFIGHYGPSFAGKVAKPAIPLWVLFLSVQLVDIAWSILVLLGIEKLRIVPGFTATNPLDLYYMPFTHSLPGAALWSVGAALVYRAIWRTQGWPASAIVGGAVFSHWILDLVVHRPDLALFDDSHKVGLGLWNYPATAFALEIALLFGGIALYLRATRPKDEIGRYGMLVFGIVAVVIQAYVFFGPPPVSDTAMALTALGLYFGFAATSTGLKESAAG